MRLTLTICALVLLGCDRNSTEIVVQKVPKQPRPVMATQMPPAPASDDRPIHWQAPDGWKELPGSSMRFATFVVNDDPKVELTVIPLAGDFQGLKANVNRWEGQLGLKPSAEQELTKLVTRIEVDKHPVDLVDLMGPDANPRLRMLGALVMHDERTWYFKMVGPEAVVGKQKENFDAFVRSIHFHDSTAEAPETAKPQAATETAPGLTYTPPPGWTKSPDRPMRIVTLTVGAAPQ